MRIDLHTHSTYSDGTDTPSQLMAEAVTARLDVIALTDHDTVDGWSEAAASRPSTVTLVPGAEISCAAHGRSVHLLAYLFDPHEPEFAEERRKLATDRVRRAQAIVERLQSLGVPITWEQVEQASSSGTIGRPHIARALVELGVVPDIPSAFTSRWLARDGRAYVEKYALDPGFAVELVRRSGGVTVLAHPMSGVEHPSVEDAELIERLAGLGLAGIEVDHPSHDDAARAHLRLVAAGLELVATGSSDYHGANKTAPLGWYLTTPEAFEALAAQATGTAPIGG
jgi:predicted metal-dependent phosphoesterase TrpH